MHLVRYRRDTHNRPAFLTGNFYYCEEPDQHNNHWRRFHEHAWDLPLERAEQLRNDFQKRDSKNIYKIVKTEQECQDKLKRDLEKLGRF